MQTDKPVTIEEPRGIIRGRRASSSTTRRRRVKLKSHVSGTFQPQDTPKMTQRVAAALRMRVAASSARRARDGRGARARREGRSRKADQLLGRAAGRGRLREARRHAARQRRDHAGHADDPRRPDRLQAERRQLAVRDRLRQSGQRSARSATTRTSTSKATRSAPSTTAQKQLLELFDRALLKRGQRRDPQQLRFLQQRRPNSSRRKAARRVRRDGPGDARPRRVPAARATHVRSRRTGEGDGNGPRRAGKAPRRRRKCGQARLPLKPVAASSRRAKTERPTRRRRRCEQAVGRAPCSKRYKARTVVHDVSLDVASGEVVGLLGPNGAGKTTCFYMIVGLVRADGGEIALDGADLSRTADPPPRAPRPVLPAAGSVDLPQADRRGEHARGARAAGRSTPTPLIERGSTRCSRTCTIDAPARRAGAVAVGRRAAPRRDRARAGDPAALHPARRAVRRRRPDRGDRDPAHHRLPEGARHRRADHRPQRARDARHLRPRLHHQRRRACWPRARRPRSSTMTDVRKVYLGEHFRHVDDARSRMKQTLQLQLSQHLTLTPQLQQSIRLLQLSTLELQSRKSSRCWRRTRCSSARSREDERAAASAARRRRPRRRASASATRARRADGDRRRRDARRRATTRRTATDFADYGGGGDGDWGGGDGRRRRRLRCRSRSRTSTLRDHLREPARAAATCRCATAQLVAALIDALDDDGYLHDAARGDRRAAARPSSSSSRRSCRSRCKLRAEPRAGRRRRARSRPNA